MSEIKKHGLKTKVGILESKKKTLEEKVEELTTPTDPTAEATKESIRLIISILIGMGVTYLYQRYPILGQLNPDSSVLVTAITAVLIRTLDKLLYHVMRNRNGVAQGVGLDMPIQTLLNFWSLESSKK